jgi:hypothetical protein
MAENQNGRARRVVIDSQWLVRDNPIILSERMLRVHKDYDFKGSAAK